MSQHINLYHDQFRPPKNPLPARYIFAAAGALAVAMLLLYGFDRWQVAARQDNLAALEARASRQEAQVETLAGQVAGRHEDPALAEELTSLEARLRALGEAEQAIKTGALGSTVGYAGHFAALSRVRVPGVWLSGIALRGQPVGMNLSGRALAGDAPARYLGALRQEPFFTGLTFAGLEIREPEKAEAGAAVGLEFKLTSQADPVPDQKGARP